MPRGSPLVAFFVVALALKKIALQIRFFSVLLSFTAAAIILGIADIMWAATTEQSLGSRLFISAVVGAVVLVGLSESIRYVYRSQHLQPAKNEAQNRQKESKNSPTISASGNVTIGHIGDVYNSDTPQIDLTKNEGVLVPSNLPTPPMPRECNIPKTHWRYFLDQM